MRLLVILASRVSPASRQSITMSTKKTSQSEALFERSQRSIPGSVNSPVRAFKAVGRSPLFIKKAQGAWITDADGNSYIDYVGSWGPMILGSAHSAVIDANREAARAGTCNGYPTELNGFLANET